MKLLLISMAALMTLFAENKPAPKPAPAKTKPAAAALTIPAGAVETEPSTFSYTDAAGKKWLYRKTPFGIVRLEDKPVPANPAIAQDAVPPGLVVKTSEDSDTVHFERPGPFGLYKWDRRKADLTREERTWVEQEQARTKARQN